MNYKYLLINLFLLTSLMGQAQSLPQFSNYRFNKLAYNPGYAGSKEALSVTSIYRNQWAAITGAPKTIHVQVHAPFLNRKCGIGFSITSDKIGVEEQSSLDAVYAYRLSLGETGKLSFGLSARLEYTSVGWNRLKLTDVVDDVLPDVSTSLLHPNFGAGIYYATPQFYLGISAPNLLKTTIFRGDSNNPFTIANDRTYYLMTGGYFKISKQVKILPSAMISLTNNAPVKLDMGVNFIFFDAFWIGGNYRFADSFDALVQYQFNKQLRIGVALDFTTSELSSYTRGSYELMAEYLFSFDGNKISNIRFF